MKWLFWLVSLPFVLLFIATWPVVFALLFAFDHIFRLSSVCVHVLYWVENAFIPWYERHIPEGRR